MPFTEAEKNHLLHVVKENSLFKGGPAITWCRDNGIMYHELTPLLELLSKQMLEEGTLSIEPTSEWAPPAESVEAFRKRMAELSAK